MAQIVLKEPDGPYSCTLDSGVMDVTLLNVFNGVQFISPSGEKLSVSMRDFGFEVHYYKDDGATGFDCGWFDFKNANPIHRMET